MGWGLTMQKRVLCTAMLTTWVGVACGGVKVMSQTPIVDGRLDEACWGKAEWSSDFRAKLSATEKTIRNQTAFAIVSDWQNIYIGLKCDESNVEAARNEPLRSLWTMNQMNLFLAPSGNGFNFYQFAFSANHGLRASFACSEGGNIRFEPDYLPEWEVKTAWGEKGWTAEVRIPVNAFYFTRADEWCETWFVNVGRVRVAGDHVEKSSWSPVQNVFGETDKFRPFDGFPKRDWRNDVSLTDVQFVPSEIVDGRIAGVVSANLHLRARGEFILTTTASGKPLEFSQLKGDKVVRIPAAFDKNGTYTIGLKLVRTNAKDGKVWPLDYNREARVRVDFRPIDVRFTRPAYRGNFYPGQDASEVCGVITTAADGEATVEIEGPGIAHQKQNLKMRHGAAEKFSADQDVSTETEYRSENVAIELSARAGYVCTKCGHTAEDPGTCPLCGAQIGSRKADKVTYTVADIYIQDISSFRTAYGNQSKVKDMCKENNGLAAINGDMYLTSLNNQHGWFVRNGVELKRYKKLSSDLCILFADGTMETVDIMTETPDTDAIYSRYPQQIWYFGPALLGPDGSAKETFTIGRNVANNNPRSAIGYYEPGHYCFIAVDGRGDERGLSMAELSKLCSDMGMAAAYNMDGGASSCLYFNGKNYGQNGRGTTDILYITEPVKEN